MSGFVQVKKYKNVNNTLFMTLSIEPLFTYLFTLCLFLMMNFNDATFQFLSSRGQHHSYWAHSVVIVIMCVCVCVCVTVCAEGGSGGDDSVLLGEQQLSTSSEPGAARHGDPHPGRHTHTHTQTHTHTHTHTCSASFIVWLTVMIYSSCSSCFCCSCSSSCFCSSSCSSSVFS